MQTVKTNSYPTNLLFVDTETMSTPHPEDKNTTREVFWFGYTLAYRREGKQRTREDKRWFYSIKEFWDYVESRLDNGRPLWIFAHNLMFDMVILDIWTEGDKRGFDIVLPVLDDPPTFICCNHERGKVNFVDTFNYWKSSVSDIGKSLGVPKLDMPKQRKMSKAWLTYCARDVDILGLAVDNLISWLMDNDLGSLSYTIASIAFNTYKHRFMPKNTIHVHDNQELLDLERESYHGGLTHCYYIGSVHKKIYKLDVNSLYPTMMLKSYPVAPHKRYTKLAVCGLRELVSSYGALARVSIKTKNIPFPYYDGSRLLEAVGEYTTVLCGDELVFALDNDCVTKIHIAQTYRMDKIFEEYVEFFYLKRLEYKKKNDPVGDQFCKLLLNSLYGKFGQQGWSWTDLTYDVLDGLYRIHGLEIPDKYQDEDNLPKFAFGVQKWTPLNYPETLTIRYLNNCLQVRLIKGEHHESCPIIASYVTSYARSYIRSLTELAGRRNVYYTDTDSLFVSEAGYRRLKRQGSIDSNILGKLKLEEYTNRLVIHGPKDYEFGVKRVTKGIRKNAQPLCELCSGSIDERRKCRICRHVTQNVSSYKQVQFEGIKGIMRRENKPYVDVSTVVKTLRREYKKGTITSSGWTEYPVLSEPATSDS